MPRGRRARPGAAGALMAVVLLCGCGGESDGSLASTVARPVDPPPIGSTTSTATTATATVPAANAIDPPAGGGEAEIDPGTMTEPATSGTPAPGASSAGSTRSIFSRADRASFARLAASLSGKEGLAVSGVGLGRPVERLGSLRSAVAWSTAKVPIAMAVIASGGASSHQTDLLRALTASDNAAAERLWTSLGSGAVAAQAGNEQLRVAGDTHTAMQAQRLRAGYTAFGQTDWALTDQARFTAGLACSEQGGQVLQYMGQVVAGQRWGLGSAGVPARFKGGWGPGSRPGAGGGYLDRQMGVLTIRGRQLAVALATTPSDGSHASGIRNLTAIARWIATHAATTGLPSNPRC
jgi:hypothetical protein